MAAHETHSGLIRRAVTDALDAAASLGAPTAPLGSVAQAGPGAPAGVQPQAPSAQAPAYHGAPVPPSAGDGRRLSPLASIVFAVLGSLGVSGGAVYAGPIARIESRIKSLESSQKALERDTVANASATRSAIESNTAALQELTAVRRESVLAIELSVDGHRYLTSVIEAIARLDHPDFELPQRTDRLMRRLNVGEALLNKHLYESEP